MKRITQLALSIGLVPVILGASASMANASSVDPEDSVADIVDAALVAVGQEPTEAELNEVPAEVVVDGATGAFEFENDVLRVTPVDAENSLVLARENGFQALTVLDDGTSVADFQIDLPEETALVENGDGFDVQLQGEGFALSIGQIDAPWAVDAEGTQLPTSYSVVDGLIRQQVDVSGAVFPVVADPLITFGLANAP